MEGRLDHPPLRLPELTLAHHKPAAEQQSNALDGLALWVVLPILAENVLGVLGCSDGVDIGPVGGGLIDVSIGPELSVHPNQKVFTGVVLIFGARRYPVIDAPRSRFPGRKRRVSFFGWGAGQHFWRCQDVPLHSPLAR